MRISIITPSFQQAAYLEECLSSVAGQGSGSVEHIVVDGGSTDGSKAILERHGTRLAWWCSEKDAGQSDAINKGLVRATGDVFTWVNSDDALLPGAVHHVATAFASDPSLQVFGGRIVHRTAAGDSIFDALNDVGDERLLFCDPVINQPATFYRTSVVRDLGGVDPALRYVMDLSLWWRFLFRYGSAHLRFEHVPLAVFRLHDESKTTTERAGFLDETASLLHRMAVDAGDTAWTVPLERLHAIRDGLMPVDAERRPEMVPRMIARFLLKWHGAIHDRRQYQAMRTAIPLIDGISGTFDPWESQRAHALRQQLRPGGWLSFRLRRKLRHLRR